MFYIYDKDTKQFNGVTTGQVNPKDKSEFLQPIHTTTTPPPTEYSINEVPVYNVELGVWELAKSQYKIDLDKALLEEVNGYGVLLYENIDGTVVERPTEVIEAETQAIIEAEAAEELELQKFNLKLTMDNNIITKAADITKGTTTESIQAFISAFALRANNAIEYVNDGLVVRYEIPGYTLGVALDTEVKIREYYNKVLVELDKFREAEIVKYLSAMSEL